MSLKTTDQIIAALIATVNSNDSSIDTSVGTIFRDVTIDTVAIEFGRIYTVLQYVIYVQSLDGFETIINDSIFREELRVALGINQTTGLDWTADEIDTMIEGHLDDLAGNFNITRRAASYATGIQRFYSNSPGTMTISQGSTVETNTTPAISYAVDTTVTATPSVEGSLYYLDVNCTAAASGISSNVIAASVSIVNPPITGVSGTTNKLAYQGGTVEETNQELINRIRIKWSGINLNTKNGYNSAVQVTTGVSDSLVLTYSDTDMLRLEPSAVDIYIKGNTNVQRSDDLIYTLTDLSIPLPYQPVVSVTSVVVGGVTKVEGTDYDTVLDTTSVYAGSYQALSKIVFITGKQPVIGTTVTVSYIYNSLVATCQAIFALAANDIVNSNVLVKQATAVLINVAGTVVRLSSYTAAAVELSVETALATFINAKTLGESINYSDIIALMDGTAGVDKVVVPLDTLARNGQTGASDVILTGYEYPIANSIVVTVI